MGTKWWSWPTGWISDWIATRTNGTNACLGCAGKQSLWKAVVRDLVGLDAKYRHIPLGTIIRSPRDVSVSLSGFC